jgi:hypothetical protein
MVQRDNDDLPIDNTFEESIIILLDKFRLIYLRTS